MIQNSHLRRVLALAVAVVSAVSPAVGFVEVGKAVEIGYGSDVSVTAVGDRALVVYGNYNDVEVGLGPFSSSRDSYRLKDAKLLGKPVACGITDKKYVVVWAAGDDNSDATIMATLKPDHNATDTRIEVGKLSQWASANFPQGPRVACTRTGFTVVWVSTGGRVVAQWYDADGMKLGSEKWVSKPKQSQPYFTTMPDVVSLTDGRMVVAWKFGGALQQRVYFANRTAAGAAEDIALHVDKFSLTAVGCCEWALLYHGSWRPNCALLLFNSQGLFEGSMELPDVSYDYSMCSIGGAIVVVWGPTYSGLWIWGGHRTSFDIGVDFDKWSYPATHPSVTAVNGLVFVAGSLNLQLTPVVNGWYLGYGGHTQAPNTPVPTPLPTPLPPPPSPSSSTRVDYLPFVYLCGAFILLMILMVGGAALLHLRRNKRRAQGEGSALLNEAPRAGATCNFSAPETKGQQD